MTTFNHYSDDSPYDLLAALDRYAEVGIDAAFDADTEELERQFVELRVTYGE